MSEVGLSVVHILDLFPTLGPYLSLFLPPICMFIPLPADYHPPLLVPTYAYITA